MWFCYASVILSSLNATEIMSLRTKGDVILTEKVRKRIFVMDQVATGQITNAQAANMPGKAKAEFWHRNQLLFCLRTYRFSRRRFGTGPWSRVWVAFCE